MSQPGRADVYNHSMRVALLTTFAVSKKEPLVAMMDRVHQAFLDAGLGEPVIRFNFSDDQLAGVSSVDRVLKRLPEVERFVTAASPRPGIPGARRISNGPLSPSPQDSVAYTTLQTIAAGVPRSFPFRSVAIHFHSPEFGELVPTPLTSAEMMAGVLLTDSWWVNGRIRSLSACAVVEADPRSKELPSLAGSVAAVLAACGKTKRTVQAPLSGKPEAASVPRVRMPTGVAIASAKPEAARAVRAIVLDYRARLKEIVDRAALPHDLPPLGSNALRDAGLDVTSGPRKPALERAFKPMGYTCRGDSGAFTLRRRTPANLTAELRLDVGTWGRNVVAMFMVWGLGFKATLLLPVSATDVVGGQYPIGDADRWQKIVENLAALVAELDSSLVPEIERAVGPSPEWYQPEK
jgi:hypothetical protein